MRTKNRALLRESRSALAPDIRERIKHINSCKSLKTEFPDQYVYFWNLFQTHPNREKKRVEEIADIELKFVAQRHGGSVFTLIYNDGTNDTISWRACL